MNVLCRTLFMEYVVCFCNCMCIIFHKKLCLDNNGFSFHIWRCRRTMYLSTDLFSDLFMKFLEFTSVIPTNISNKQTMLLKLAAFRESYLPMQDLFLSDCLLLKINKNNFWNHIVFHDNSLQIYFILAMSCCLYAKKNCVVLILFPSSLLETAGKQIFPASKRSSPCDVYKKD